MAILEIKKFNNPILKHKCKEVEEIDEDINKLVDSMEETMEKNHGIGLAAPQIGVQKRIIVMRPDLNEFNIFYLINPKITKKSPKTEIKEEGCLSFPGLFLKIKRAKEIEVEGQDLNGKKIKIRVQGLSARILQHEIDHLNGVLFIDRLSFFQRWKLKKKLKNL